MIPTLIGFGLIFGRWWLLSLVVAAVGWPLVLIEGDIVGADVPLLVGAAGLAVINTGVGVLVHQGVRAAIGAARERHHVSRVVESGPSARP